MSPLLSLTPADARADLVLALASRWVDLLNIFDHEMDLIRASTSCGGPYALHKNQKVGTTEKWDAYLNFLSPYLEGRGT